MTILLLGVNGQLGRSFIEDGRLATRGKLIVASRDGKRFDQGAAEIADLSAPETLSASLDRIQPQIIINTAAYTAVDRSEQEEPLATCVNGQAVDAIAAWSAAHGAMVVHYSTDYVFDGSATTPYTADAPTAPLGAYGRSKLAGEIALRQHGAAHLILRTAWVYAAHGQNFLRTMLRLGAERDELRVVADQYGAPTSTDIIVDGTLAALDVWMQANATAQRKLEGTYHLVASGQTSWQGFASAIFEAAQASGLITRKPHVQPITSAEFPTAAQRPAWSVLDNTCFQHTFDHVLPSWQDGLRGVIDTLSSQAR